MIVDIGKKIVLLLQVNKNILVLLYFLNKIILFILAELVVDKAVELKYIGGVCGANIRPTPFLCLVLKMLQICPEKDIIVEFIKNEEFK